MGDPGVGQRLRQQRGQPVGVGIQGGVHGVVGMPERGQTRRHGDRVPRQGPGLIHRPQWGQALHHLGSSAEGCRRQSPTHHLAEGE